MALPERLDITLQQGDSFGLWWAIEMPDGTVPDLIALGYTTGRALIRPDYDADPVVRMTTGNGGVVIDRQQDANGEWWNGYLYASPAITKLLVEWGEGVWDLVIESASSTVTVYKGKADLSPVASKED